MIMEVGRVCRKLRGKDAGAYCVVVEKVDDSFVMIDAKGAKRSKANVLHLEPLPTVLEIKKGAATEDNVKKLAKELK